MSNIDNRIVEMYFDNKQFEKGVQTSIKSLENLKHGLQLEESAKNLTNLEQVGRNFSLANISEGVETIKHRFSALGIVGLTILQDLTRAALGFGRTVVKSVLGPMIEGGKKRALNIEQAKFQFRGLGMDIEATMEDALYAVTDTAYGLDEAAKVASQLGASGMRAGDEMKKALRGVSGVAAMTSSSYEDIGRVFTKVAGNGRLMGQELLQLSGRGLNAAAVLAESLGKTEAEVRKMVSEGKISFKMFYTAMDEAFGEHATKANETYSGSLANVRANLAKIGEDIAISHFENMKDVFNELIPAIKEVRKHLLPFIEDYNKFARGVTENLIKALKKIDLTPIAAIAESVKNIFVAIGSIVKPIKDAFVDIFPPATSEQIFKMGEGLKAFTSSLKLSSETSEKVKRTFKGLFAILDIGKTLLKAVLDAVLPIIGALVPMGDNVLDLTGGLGDLLVSLRDIIKESDIFHKILMPISKVLTKVAEGVRYVIDKIVGGILSLGKTDTTDIENLGKRVERGFKPFTAIAKLVKGAAEIIGKVFKKLAPLFSGLAKGVGSGLEEIRKRVSNWLDNADFSKGFDLANLGLTTAILLGIRKFIKSLTSITEKGSGIIQSIKDIFGGITGSLKALQSNLKADTLMKIAGAIAILTISVVALSMIDSAKLTMALTAIAVLFTELFASMAIFEKIMSSSGFRSMGKIAFMMIGLSVAVLLLSSAMTKIAKLDWKGIAKGMVTIAGLTGILITTAKLLSGSSGKMMKGATGFIFFAIAINILTKAVQKLGELDISTLTKGLVGVGILVAELALFMKVADLDGMGLFKGLGLLALAGAVVVLSNAVRKIGELDISTITKGLVGMGLILTELVIFMKLTGGEKRTLSTAIALTVMGTAMVIFSKALRSMGGMTWEEIAKGLITLAGALGIIATAMHFMTGALPGAAALLVVAGALAVLTPVLKILGGMTLSEIGKGLLALAGAFTVLGLAAVVLGPLTPALLGLAGSIALLGAAMLAAGVGISLFSVGLATLAVSGTAGAAAMVMVVTTLIGLIPMALKQVGHGLLLLVEVIGDGVPIIIKAVTKILTAILETVKKVTPDILDTVTTLILSILKTLSKAIPGMIDAGMEIIKGILKGIKKHIGEITSTAIEIVVEFINGIASKIGDVIDAGFNLIISFVEGLADAIDRNTERMENAMTDLIHAMLNAARAIILAPLKGVYSLGKEMVQGLIDGVLGMFTKAGETMRNLGSKLLSSIKNKLEMESPSKVMRDEVGRYIVQGIAEGITADTSAEEAAKKKAQNIVSAFKDEFDNIDLSLTTKGLEHQLWMSIYGDKATDTQILDREIALLDSKVLAQQEKVNLSLGEYENMATVMGDNAIQTREAYNKYLQEQITFNNLLKEQNDIRDQLIEENRDSFMRYAEYLADYKEKLTELGLTQEEINKLAMGASGYDPDIRPLQNHMMNDTRGAIEALNVAAPQFEVGGTEIINSMLKGYSSGAQTTPQAMQNTMSGLLKVIDENKIAFTAAGQGTITAYSTGIGAGRDAISIFLRKMLSDMVQQIIDRVPDFEKAGVAAVEGFIKGMESQIEAAAKAAAAIAIRAYNAAMSAIGADSPSRKFAELGKWACKGFAEGLYKYSIVSEQASESVSKRALSMFNETVSKITDLLESDKIFTPTITPVLDLTKIAETSKKIPQLLDTKPLYVDEIGYRLNRTTKQKDVTVNDKPNNTEPQVQFTQNNYSPKALSRIDIYRQTKNQLSTLKGVLDNK